MNPKWCEKNKLPALSNISNKQNSNTKPNKTITKKRKYYTNFTRTKYKKELSVFLSNHNKDFKNKIT